MGHFTNVVKKRTPAEPGAERSVLLGAGEWYRYQPDATWQIANDWSVGLWAKRNVLHGGASRLLFDLTPDTGNSSAIFCSVGSTGLVSINIAKTAGGGILWATTYSGVFTDTDWHHVMLSWDGTDFVLHKDGVVVAGGGSPTDNRPGTMANDVRQMGWGQASEFDLTPWENSLGHLGIWDTALTTAAAAEITSGGHGMDLTTNTGNYTNSGNLMHYYRPGFVEDEAEPGATDETVVNSGNARDLTVTGIDATNIQEDAP